VLVEVKATGVNPVETYVRAGGNGYNTTLPYTPGADGAGVVVDAPSSARFKVAPPHTFSFLPNIYYWAFAQAGDRVYFAGTITGSYASHALAREVRGNSSPPPPPATCYVAC
jgi:NADPH2:quinone reductase